MDVVIRKSMDNVWCFVEEFSVYRYIDKGSITVTVVVSPEGKLATPYIYRGEKFIPLSVIEEEMGIEKYINAKKPFYSNLADGFIAKIKVGLNFVTGEFLPEKSVYTIYSIGKTFDMKPSQGKLQLIRVLNIPEQVHELMLNLSKEIASCGGDRAKYLRSRMVVEEVQKENE